MNSVNKIDGWLNAVRQEMIDAGHHREVNEMIIDLIVYAVQRDPKDLMPPREMAARIIAAKAMGIKEDHIT